MTMMDRREALPKGTVLNFPGIACEIGNEIGRGSNALVYQGSYRDALERDRYHRVLIKELFPFHPQGKIYRNKDGRVTIEADAEAVYQMHRLSFEAGNRAHLELLESCPEQIGANLNTFSLNGTLYSILGVSGGESLSKIQKVPARSLRSCASRMLAVLDALEIFHANGLAHLDIAPDNIMLLGSGNRERALLIDFNSAMAVGLAGQKESAVFSIKQGYTAPEVRSGRLKDIGFASDMYSLTAVLYWMIAGKALSNFQMIRALPPDVSECPCVAGEPETVKAWTREILRRGLQTLPTRRYKDTCSMRRDLEELIDRIDGVGITHWALWEAGRAQVERMVRENPSLSFIRDSANLFPSMVKGPIFPAGVSLSQDSERSKATLTDEPIYPAGVSLSQDSERSKATLTDEPIYPAGVSLSQDSERSKTTLKDDVRKAFPASFVPLESHEWDVNACGIKSYPADECIRDAEGNYMLLAGGGMGKTTSLLRVVFSEGTRYAPDRPAIIYLSLYGYQPGDTSFIIDSILYGLHFRPETHTYEDARKALYELIDEPIKTGNGEGPVLRLLLDGLNEVTCDPKLLLDEINRLAGMRGIRIVVASRANEKVISFPELQLTELTDDMVKETLSREGLLLPESMDMRRALRTPMLLSMYVKSGQIGQSQVRVKTEDELLRAYLSSLKEKAVRDLPEQTNRRWQIDVALDFVLPAIASEINKRQCGRNDKDLLPIVDECYRILNGRLSRRFFPQWIGRTASIRGNARNSEEWYGQIMHDILWKQMGLIARDNQGRYVVSHQLIEEYLLELGRENRQRIERYHWLRAAIIFVCLCVVAAFSALFYKTYIAPPPYDEAYAVNVMSRALDAYVTAGRQYETISNLTECAINSPKSFEDQLGLYKNALPYNTGMSRDSSLQYLESMLDTGEVMPWSNKAMDEDAYIKLINLPLDRAEEYRLFVSVLEFVMSDEYANRYYGEQYPKLLLEVLETDAYISSELYQIACSPHLAGKYTDHTVTAESYAALFSSVSKQNGHLTGEDVKQSQESLTNFEGKRREQLGMLYQCGAFAAFEQRMA